MVDPPSLQIILSRIDQLYRPSLRGHWRRRVINRLQGWTGRPDLTLHWTQAEETADAGVVRLPLPNRSRPPRFLSFDRPLDGHARQIAELLASHVTRVAILMEGDTSGPEVPARWNALLAPRQLEVALLAANGTSNEDIGETLGIAPRTVARQLQDVFRRLTLSNRAGLAAECALGRPPTPFIPSDGQ
ncbi:MAG: DNA-binding CsgD family transcriptional regulator [Bradymonadia bacterium]|jgi:DNA-binding CsgD family transcriptional regulator